MADRNVRPTKNRAQRGADIPVCRLSEQTLSQKQSEGSKGESWARGAPHAF
jgi:hypothetical protein